MHTWIYVHVHVYVYIYVYIYIHICAYALGSGLTVGVVPIIAGSAAGQCAVVVECDRRVRRFHLPPHIHRESSHTTPCIRACPGRDDR